MVSVLVDSNNKVIAYGDASVVNPFLDGVIIEYDIDLLHDLFDNNELHYIDGNIVISP